MSQISGEKSCSSLFKEPLWLGFRHDGYPQVPFSQYRSIRGIPSASGREEAAALQGWLTFGLIEAVVEKHVPESSLIKKSESGKYVLSKDNLREILRDWIDRILGGMKNEELTAWSMRVHKTLTQAHSMMISLLRLDAFTYPLAEADDIPATVCLIGRIGEELTNTKMVFPRHIPQQGFSWSIVWRASYNAKYQDEMIKNGWCPFTIHYLSSTMSLSSLEYASTKQPMEQEKKHDYCTKKQCKANTVDLDNYVPKHTSRGCSCEASVPSLEIVKAALARNEVPVITISREAKEDSPASLSVRSTSETPYIAISHVWADGLGSTTEKGLPECQVQRLTSLASKVLDHGAFWIDALCVPDFKDVRKRAIGLMAQTYRDAAVVLVLDTGIQLCSSTVPLEEKLLRVLISGWMQRLWTLQEAVLAKKLVFLFSDELVPLPDLLPTGREMPLSALKTDLAAEIFRLSKNDFSIGDVARSLRWRATSRSEDETLAIASLLGVEASALVNLSPDQRLVNLLSTVRKLPSNVLFLTGPKLKLSGFRWAPVSLMTAHGGSVGGLQMSTAETDAVCTPQGLLSVYSALVFPPSTIDSGKAWMLEDAKNMNQYIIHDPYAQPGSYRCNILLYSQPIPPGGATACVAVLKTLQLSSSDTDGGFMVHCDYQRRLVIQNVPFSDSNSGKAIVVNTSGRLKVCVA